MSFEQIKQQFLLLIALYLCIYVHVFIVHAQYASTLRHRDLAQKQLNNVHAKILHVRKSDW